MIVENIINIINLNHQRFFKLSILIKTNHQDPSSVWNARGRKYEQNFTGNSEITFSGYRNCFHIKKEQNAKGRYLHTYKKEKSIFWYFIIWLYVYIVRTYIQSVKSIYQYFGFFEKSCQYRVFRAEITLEGSDNFTFYRGIPEFLNSFSFFSFFENITVFKIYAVVAISQKILWNDNNSIKAVIFYVKEFKIPTFLKNNGFWAVVAISQNFLRNENYSIKFKQDWTRPAKKGSLQL